MKKTMLVYAAVFVLLSVWVKTSAQFTENPNQAQAQAEERLRLSQQFFARASKALAKVSGIEIATTVRKFWEERFIASAFNRAPDGALLFTTSTYSREVRPELMVLVVATQPGDRFLPEDLRDPENPLVLAKYGVSENRRVLLWYNHPVSEKWLAATLVELLAIPSLGATPTLEIRDAVSIKAKAEVIGRLTNGGFWFAWVENRLQKDRDLAIAGLDRVFGESWSLAEEADRRRTFAHILKHPEYFEQ